MATPDPISPLRTRLLRWVPSIVGAGLVIASAALLGMDPSLGTVLTVSLIGFLGASLVVGGNRYLKTDTIRPADQTQVMKWILGILGLLLVVFFLVLGSLDDGLPHRMDRGCPCDRSRGDIHRNDHRRL